jgi:hypothetical protein
MNTQADSILSALAPDLQEMAASIASQSGVTVFDVLIEAARDGLTAIKPRWEARQQRGGTNATS